MRDRHVLIITPCLTTVFLSKSKSVCLYLSSFEFDFSQEKFSLRGATPVALTLTLLLNFLKHAILKPLHPSAPFYISDLNFCNSPPYILPFKSAIQLTVYNYAGIYHSLTNFISYNVILPLTMWQNSD